MSRIQWENHPIKRTDIGNCWSETIFFDTNHKCRWKIDWKFQKWIDSLWLTPNRVCLWWFAKNDGVLSWKVYLRLMVIISSIHVPNRNNVNQNWNLIYKSIRIYATFLLSKHIIEFHFRRRFLTSYLLTFYCYLLKRLKLINTRI